MHRVGSAVDDVFGEFAIKETAMPSMFQHATAKAHPSQSHVPLELPSFPQDQDVALGFESAYPALQFEGWEPQLPVLPTAQY